jgi:hypothetical protein
LVPDARSSGGPGRRSGGDVAHDFDTQGTRVETVLEEQALHEFRELRRR